MRVFYDANVANPILKIDRTALPAPTPGAAPAGCDIHKASRTAKTGDSVFPAERQVWKVPRPVTRAFLDEAGRPLCAYCVADGIRSGAVDVANPADLLRAPDPLFVEPEGVAEARAALPYWGMDSLDILDRAIEAARRHGRLEELRDRFLDVLDIRLESQVSQEDEPPRGPRRRIRR